MDQLIHDANSQIKALQDKMEGEVDLPRLSNCVANSLAAMQAEHGVLEKKNVDLGEAFKQKAQALQHTTRLYQALKAQIMASHIATAAGDEAELTLQTARGDGFIDRLPGTRTGTVAYSPMTTNQRVGGDRLHGRNDSRSSSSGRQQRGNIEPGHNYAPHLQGYSIGSRMGTSRRSPFSHGALLS
jgi:hypothetical protein